MMIDKEKETARNFYSFRDILLLYTITERTRHIMTFNVMYYVIRIIAALVQFIRLSLHYQIQ